MSGETSDLVAHSLGWNDSNLGGDNLVGVEIKSKLGVVLLDDDTSGLLNGLSADTLKKKK